MQKYPWSEKENQRRADRRPKPKLRQVKIKAASKKRAKQNREYQVVRIQYLIDNPTCQMKVICSGAMATEVHHAKGKIGELLTNTNFFKATCRPCHDWELKNSAEAKEMGLSVNRIE